MRIFPVYVVMLLLIMASIEGRARDALAMWDSRCEECHGDPDKFAGKYLWNIDGELQGRHHVDNLSLFMRNHFIPDHEIESIRDMLLAKANSPLRFETECGDCHGDAGVFVAESLWVRGNEITGMASGMGIMEFLPTHRKLQPEDVDFYRRLFARIAGKPLPD